MKRTIALLLALAMLLSLTACTGSAPAETRDPEPAPVVTEAPTEAPTTEPTTEPTLSPEEVLYNSLPDRAKQAVDVGIVGLDVLNDLTRICTGTEAAQMLQNARVLKRGVESVVLGQVKDSEHADIEVTRFWMAQMMYAAEMEYFAEPVSGEYLENIQYLVWDGISEINKRAGGYFSQPWWLVGENYGTTSLTDANRKGKIHKWCDQDTVVGHGFVSSIADFHEINWEVKDKPEEWMQYVDYGSFEPIVFVVGFSDRTKG